ncbi:hypothetical protein [Ferrimicrobium acidiphilum]|uniref:hypothetical protein n=1 Tax=Ferrimicrobium acidiphilum TaxID=121039 RepID=UPI000696D772
MALTSTVTPSLRAREFESQMAWLPFPRRRSTRHAKGLEDLARFLVDAGVSTVVMEATGVYWKPVYYALEGLFPRTLAL